MGRPPKIGMYNSVAFDSDWRSPMQYEIDLDYPTSVNFAHCSNWVNNFCSVVFHHLYQYSLQKSSTAVTLSKSIVKQFEFKYKVRLHYQIELLYSIWRAFFVALSCGKFFVVKMMFKCFAFFFLCFQKNGVEKNLGIPKTIEYEAQLIENAMLELQSNIKKGIDFMSK